MYKHILTSKILWFFIVITKATISYDRDLSPAETTTTTTTLKWGHQECAKDFRMIKMEHERGGDGSSKYQFTNIHHEIIEPRSGRVFLAIIGVVRRRYR